MSNTLIIVESPNKCPKIRKFVGSGYSVQASVGHIREISKDCPPLNPQNQFLPTYEIYRDKRDVVKKLKEEAKKSDTILIATDPDREGEAIAWHIYDIFDKTSQKKCKRIVFNEITSGAVLKAIASPRNINHSLVYAQKARQVLDRLIGFTVSPVLWQHVASKTSAGRVQSVALKIICERQLEIEAFVPTSYWHIDANLKCKDGNFVARLQTTNADNRLLDKKSAEDAVKALKKTDYWIGGVKSSKKALSPNAPFDTSLMQSTCSSLFGWSLTKTMQLAQKLYESSYISYIRTDSYSISEEALKSVRSFISSEYGKEFLPKESKVYLKKSGASAQEAHECIRPTDLYDSGSELGDDLLKLYKLIRSRFIACQMSDAQVAVTEYSVKTASGHHLVASGKLIEFSGWMREYDKYIKTKETLLPNVEKNEALKLLDLKHDEKSTKPPDRYNDGSLVKKLESEGVGRPSTHASILKTLIDREYVKREGKILTPTDLGMRVYLFLNKSYQDFFMDIKYTSRLEDQLDEIAKGDAEFLDVVEPVYFQLQKKQESLVKLSGAPVCTVCKTGNIVEKDGKWGKWYTCNQFPRCKTTFYKQPDGSFKQKIR
jgi:DNA topoisomerase-1